MIKAISFDFYGVMYSNLDWKAIDARIYPDEAKAHEFQRLVESANQGVIDNERFRYRVAQLAEDDSHKDSKAVHLEPVINTALMEYVQELKDKDHIKLAILSNGTREHVCSVLEENNILEAFDLIATSAELPNYKPEPAAFKYVATHLGIKNEELLHVDDSPRHVEGAQEAGMKTILYKDLAQLESELAQFFQQQPGADS